MTERLDREAVEMLEEAGADLATYGQCTVAFAHRSTRYQLVIVQPPAQTITGRTDVQPDEYVVASLGHGTSVRLPRLEDWHWTFLGERLTGPSEPDGEAVAAALTGGGREATSHRAVLAGSDPL